jgi:fibronectin type 3 domain-containing protein
MKRIAVVLALAIALAPSQASAQQFVVKLSWTASSSAAANPSLAYNVYRAPSCAGHFALINPAPVTGTSYVDASVAAGAAYCYQVTAIVGGVESSPSNQTVAAIPLPTDRQAVCAHRGPIIGWLRCLGSRPKRPAVSPVLLQ